MELKKLELSKEQKAIKFIAELSVDRASQILSKILKHGSKIELSNISLYDITEFSKKMFKENQEIVGAMTTLMGDAPFRFLFWVEFKDSLKLTDMFLRKAVGSTKEFSVFAESTVQETGNILSSAVCNIFSRDFGVKMKPSLPCIFNDYSGVIFEEVIQDVAKNLDQIMVIETKFHVIEQELNCFMLILPESGSVETLGFLTGAV